MRFMKLKTRHDAQGGSRILHLQVLSVGPAGVLGRRINPQTLEDQSFTDPQGTIHDVQNLIHYSAILWIQEMREDRTYGNLTPAGIRTKWDLETWRQGEPA